MKEFLEKLRQQVAENPPNYGDASTKTTPMTVSRSRRISKNCTGR